MSHSKKDIAVANMRPKYAELAGLRDRVKKPTVKTAALRRGLKWPDPLSGFKMTPIATPLTR